MTSDEQTAAKKRYAETLIRVPDPFAAALQLYPEDTRIAAWIAKHWPQDPEVIAEKKALVEAGVGSEDLPGKSDLSRAIWDRMTGVTVGGVRIPIASDDFAKLAKIYAEINSYIEKPSATTNVTAQIIVPKVIEIPNHGSNEDWEAIAEKQQKDLLNVSRNRS